MVRGALGKEHKYVLQTALKQLEEIFALVHICGDIILEMKQSVIFDDVLSEKFLLERGRKISQQRKKKEVKKKPTLKASDFDNFK